MNSLKRGKEKRRTVECVSYANSCDIHLIAKFTYNVNFWLDDFFRCRFCCATIVCCFFFFVKFNWYYNDLRLVLAAPPIHSVFRTNLNTIISYLLLMYKREGKEVCAVQHTYRILMQCDFFSSPLRLTSNPMCAILQCIHMAQWLFISLITREQ